MAEVTYTKTVCQKRPECCEPRHIRAVYWDADGTMWDIEPPVIASSIHGRLEKIDDNTVVCHEEPYSYGYGTEITPKPKAPKGGGVYQVWDEETGQWVWGHHKKKSERWWKHPLRFKPSYVSDEEWEREAAPLWPEEEQQVQEIAEELVQSLPESQQRFLEESGEVETELLQLMPPERPKELPPPKEKPKYEPRKITIKLLPTFRDTVRKLNEMGIKQAIISLNTPGSVKRIIGAFGMTGEFVDIMDTWGNKGKVFDELTQKHKVCGCDAMFVDNTLGHVEEVSKKCGLALFIGKGGDIEVPEEVLQFIEKM